MGGGGAHSQAQAGALGGGLLDSLVLFAVGGITTTTTQRVRGRIGEEKVGADEDVEQEEEIGMRRECMRALLGMTESEEARDTVRDERDASMTERRLLFFFLFF